MKLVTFLLIGILILGSTSKQQENKKLSHFPRIMWVYWHQGLQSASTFTKLCINNMKHHAKQGGWTFKLITLYNMHQYLNKEYVINLWKLSKIQNTQSLSDIVRINLLLKYGGMWMDANSFFVEDISWIDSIKGIPHFYNQYGDQPEVVLGSFAKDPYIQHSNKINETVLPLPNVEAWFMLSTPNNSFIQNVAATLDKVVNLGRIAANQYYASLGVKQPFTETDYFLVSNYIFQVVLQLKQVELDKISPNLYSMNYYKVWNMEGYKTCFMWHHMFGYKYNIFLSDIFKYPMNYFEQNYQRPRYFVKLTSSTHPLANQILNKYLEYHCFGYNFVIKKKSIIEEYLLKYSDKIEDIQKVIQYQQLAESSSKGDQLLNLCSSIVKKKQDVSYDKQIIIVSIVIILAYSILFWGIELRQAIEGSI